MPFCMPFCMPFFACHFACHFCMPFCMSFLHAILHAIFACHFYMPLLHAIFACHFACHFTCLFACRFASRFLHAVSHADFYMLFSVCRPVENEIGLTRFWPEKAPLCRIATSITILIGNTDTFSHAIFCMPFFTCHFLHIFICTAWQAFFAIAVS